MRAYGGPVSWTSLTAFLGYTTHNRAPLTNLLLFQVAQQNPESALPYSRLSQGLRLCYTDGLVARRLNKTEVAKKTPKDKASHQVEATKIWFRENGNSSD